MRAELIYAVLGIVVFGTIAFICLFRAPTVQRWAIRRLAADSWLNRLFREYVETDGYIAQTWFVGLVAGVAAALCFWALQSITGG